MPNLTARSLSSLALALLLTAGNLGTFSPAQAAQQAVPAEHNPPGDIPDTQVFITYEGPGFSMKVPEGWSRRDAASGATFNDKYNLIEVSATSASTAPTVASVEAREVKQLKALDRAAKITHVKTVDLKGGRAIRIDYAINSGVNPVTNKRIRLEDVRYLVFKNGILVSLDMAAPYGADNADQWNLMANSIRIK
jgi:hypothetical protein